MSTPTGSSGGKPSSNLVSLITKWEKLEITSDRDLYQYARLMRAIGQEMSLRLEMDGDWISALLSQYKGKWYTFGVQSKIRGKLVGAHLRLSGAGAAKIMGMSGVKMWAAFQRHFVKPELDAKAKAEAKKNGGKGKSKGFTIGDKPADGTPGGRAA